MTWRISADRDGLMFDLPFQPDTVSHRAPSCPTIGGISTAHSLIAIKELNP
jgi:hypothetical protein